MPPIFVPDGHPYESEPIRKWTWDGYNRHETFVSLIRSISNRKPTVNAEFEPSFMSHQQEWTQRTYQSLVGAREAMNLHADVRRPAPSG